MRFMLKVNIPVETGNAAAKAGKLGATIKSILADLKPEAVSAGTSRPALLRGTALPGGGGEHQDTGPKPGATAGCHWPDAESS